jgi:hypothetical protein
VETYLLTFEKDIPSLSAGWLRDRILEWKTSSAEFADFPSVRDRVVKEGHKVIVHTLSSRRSSVSFDADLLDILKEETYQVEGRRVTNEEMVHLLVYNMIQNRFYPPAPLTLAKMTVEKDRR